MKDIDAGAQADVDPVFVQSSEVVADSETLPPWETCSLLSHLDSEPITTTEPQLHGLAAFRS